MTDGFGACIRYAYDCLGNVVTEQRKISGDSPEHEIWQKIWYRYDKTGRRIEKKERMEGNGNPAFAMTQYRYDQNGNLSEIITPNGHRMIREYDYCDRLIEKETPDHGSWQYQYNANDRILTQSFGKNPIVYQTYYLQGNVIQLHNDLGELVQKLTYDQAKRVQTQEDAGQAVTRIAYTANGRP